MDDTQAILLCGRFTYAIWNFLQKPKDADGSRETSAETISAEAGNFFSIEEPASKFSLLAAAKVVLSDCWANHGISHYLTYINA